MIVSERKPFQEIKAFVDGYRKILVVGCGSCATVCLSGGENEVRVLSSALRIASLREGKEKDILEATITRQCEPEFVEPIQERVKRENIEAVLSLGCGVGVNFLAERVGDIPVYPGSNTNFMGGNVEPGVWKEFCAACGNCILYLTGGLCPIARCAKTIMNGPCGGSNKGKCEINRDVDCIWDLIVKRMQRLGKLDELQVVLPARDWSTSRDGGPRRLVREDLRKVEAAQGTREAAR